MKSHCFRIKPPYCVNTATSFQRPIPLKYWSFCYDEPLIGYRTLLEVVENFELYPAANSRIASDQRTFKFRARIRSTPRALDVDEPVLYPFKSSVRPQNPCLNSKYMYIRTVHDVRIYRCYGLFSFHPCSSLTYENGFLSDGRSSCNNILLLYNAQRRWRRQEK